MQAYCFDDFENMTDGLYNRIFRILPKQIQAKIVSTNNQDLRAKRLMAHLLLMVLFRQNNINTDSPIMFTDNNKPYVQGIQFSISHCSSAVAVAVNNTPIGIDVQDIIDYEPKIARYICNDDELLILEKSNNKSQELTVLWCKKESTIKCLGKTIATSMKDIIDDKYQYVSEVAKSYVLSVCVTKS